MQASTIISGSCSSPTSPTTSQSKTRLISKAFSTQYKQTKNTSFSLPWSELNNICKCIYVYRKKSISEKNVNPVNQKIEENLRGKYLTYVKTNTSRR